ncbi:hypothetical protein ACTWQB_09450 [Piscibacillus sp. B03]
MHGWIVALSYLGYYRFESLKYKDVSISIFATNRQSAWRKLRSFLAN